MLQEKKRSTSCPSKTVYKIPQKPLQVGSYCEYIHKRVYIPKPAIIFIKVEAIEVLPSKQKLQDFRDSLRKAKIQEYKSQIRQLLIAEQNKIIYTNLEPAHQKLQQEIYEEWIPEEWWKTAQECCDAVDDFLKHTYLLKPVRNYLRSYKLNFISRSQFSALIARIMEGDQQLKKRVEIPQFYRNRYKDEFISLKSKKRK